MAKLSAGVPVILSCCLVLLIVRPILGAVWYPVHDTTHIARLYLMEQSIRMGQFPPIWAEGINNGYGYPLFHFYAPLFYYVALIAKLIAGSYIGGIKIALFIFLTLGGWGIYALAKRWGKLGGVVAMTAFLMSPYLAVNLYVRGAYAEIAALTLLPWVLVSWENTATRRGQAAAAGITALFLISHNLIPLAAFPLIAVWVIAVNHHRLKHLVVPALLTLLLAAGYLLPLVFERTFVQADKVARTTDYALHFVYPWQLWNSTWGFGGSALGVEDGLSFKVGKVQLILAVLGIGYLLIKRKWRGVYWGIAGIGALWMSTTLARPVWDALPFLAVIQFPWRYLGVAAVLIAAVSAGAVAAVPIRLIRFGAAGIMIAALMALNLKLFAPATVFNADDSIFMGKEYLATVSQIIPEFMPVWMKTVPVKPPQNNLDRAYYPTWKASINGENVPIRPDEQGIIEYPGSADRTHIVLSQSHTMLERVGYALTILGIIAAVYLGRMI